MKRMIICLFFAFALLINFINAQDFDKSKLPKLLGASNAGTEFYFTFFPCWETPNAVNAIKIYVSSSVVTDVNISVEGKGFSETKQTVPNDVIEFSIPPSIGQPYRKTDRDIPLMEQVFPDAAVHIRSGAPIVCYGVVRYMYTSDGFLGIPVNSLGNEYIVASFADPADGRIQYLPSYSGIAAPYDETQVTFTMGGTDFSKTAGGLSPGETTKFNMNSGDVVIIGGLGAHAEITGSKITSTNPISVVSGNFCAYIPTNCGCCDIIIEQEIPTFSWGTEYHVTKIVDRLKNSIIKVFAKEDNTKIYRDYQQIGLIKNAGGVEGTGYLHLRADEGYPRPIVISGDKPINVTQFNTGQQDDGISSDPFQMVLEPIEQYQREIVFNTPGIKGGFGFPKNHINLCYRATDDGQIPDDLLFAQVVDGDFIWQRIRDFSSDPGMPFVVGLENKHYFSKTLTLPGDGVYKIKANDPFAAYAYGFSDYDSYGFPTAGTYIENHDDKIPPVPVWSDESNGLVKGTIDCGIASVIQSRFQINSVANQSSLSMVMLYEPESYNYELKYDEFIPGNDNKTNWELTVKDINKDAKAVLFFSDRSGNDTVLVFDYKATSVDETNDKANLTINPQPVKNELNLGFLSAQSSNVSINLLDATGKTIKKLFTDRFLEKGNNNLQFDVSGVANGTYFVEIMSGNQSITRKFVIVR